MKGKKTRRIDTVRRWVRDNRLRLAWGVPAALAALLLIVQLLYPSDRLLPFQSVDEVRYGFATKESVVKALDKRYQKVKVDLYFGKAKQPQFTPRLSDAGIAVKNSSRIDDLAYRWYWRLVPSSILWVQHVVEPSGPSYQRDSKVLSRYLKTELKGSCSVAPKNATAEVVDGEVRVVPDEEGGVCREQDVKKALNSLEPQLPGRSTARVAMDPRPATLRASDVKEYVDTINDRLSAPVQLNYDDSSHAVPVETITQWLTFTTDDDTFGVTLDEEKSADYLHANLDEELSRPAGVTKVTTRDFVEVSRTDGAPGRAIDVGATRDRIVEYLMAATDVVEVGVVEVEPKVDFTRSYSSSDTGLSALMAHFADTHPGVYGVSLIELDGKRRRASYNDMQKFTTASTYKLYVAFSTLKRIESGEFKWSDQVVGGRSLEQCFEDMIAKSDNPCSEALVAKIGYRPITLDAQTIVSANTTFLDTESYKTTAGDLSTFMAALETGQMSLRSESIERLKGSLRRNIFRQGIPAGASGDVADKVGFLQGFLHDAAIVYSPSGTYALSIMTDGSSWGDIAKLTREIEKLRG